MEFAEYVACIQTLEDIQQGKYKPQQTMFVKKGLGELRTALTNNDVSVRPLSNDGRDLQDLTTLEIPDKREKKPRGRDPKKKKPRSRSKPFYGRESRSPSVRGSSASSYVSTRSNSLASRGSYSSSKDRSGSRGSRSGRSGSRGSQGSRQGSRSATRRETSKDRSGNFNVDSKRRSNKPNKENYNKDRSNNKTGRDKESRSAKDRNYKPRQSRDTRQDKSSSAKNQKLCPTCATHNTCPPGKCLQYPKDVDHPTECSRCKRGCHSSERCVATKN